MRLFVSYPSKYRGVVEPVAHALRNGGHTVFFDRHDLPAGQAYDERIAEEIDESTAMIFFVAPESFVSGSYQLSELEMAQGRWPSADRRVLPVSLAPVDLEHFPPYLRSVTILERKGNLAADVLGEVRKLRRWDRRRALMPLALAAALGLALVLGLIVPRAPTAPTELTADTVDAVVDRIVPEAEEVHVKQIVKAENARPFLFVVYEAGREIVFAAIKWRDGEWRIARTVRDEIDDFLVSSWQAEVDEASSSIVFNGCRPRSCSDVWGYLYYQFDLDRAWMLKASSLDSGPEVMAPLQLPERPRDLYHFERRFYATVAHDLDSDALIDAAILALPRRRAVAPMWERGYEESEEGLRVEARFLAALGRPTDTRVDLIYREDLDGDGVLEWLVQTATGRQSVKRLHVIVGSRALRIFEDPGDVDAAWTRFAVHPVPGQAPYLAVGGRAGSGGFPFWYVLQAGSDGRVRQLAASAEIEGMLEEAFERVFRDVQR